jgi:hypothetical protein
MLAEQPTRYSSDAGVRRRFGRLRFVVRVNAAISRRPTEGAEMKYAFTIYGEESARESATPEDMEATTRAYMAFTQEVQDKGILLAGEGLYPTPTATTVRVRDGERSVTDGPFAESKEQLGGFYVLDCKDLDEAIEWAAKIPGAQHGSVEIRPVMVFDEAGHLVEEATA